MARAGVMARTRVLARARAGVMARAIVMAGARAGVMAMLMWQVMNDGWG